MIQVRRSNISISQSDGESDIVVQIRLAGFKSSDEANKFLSFLAKSILAFEGQTTLEKK
jgi:hypothetical protein